jgi:hypothetical protein
MLLFLTYHLKTVNKRIYIPGIAKINNNQK